jgi:hypothetical protein
MQNKNKHTSIVTTGSPEIPGLPCAMVLTVSFVLSPVTGLFCHRRFRIIIHKLDASVGASGPHDFAVRQNAARLAPPKRPSHPAPNVRDDAYAPLRGRETSERKSLIWGERQAFDLDSSDDKMRH